MNASKVALPRSWAAQRVFLPQAPLQTVEASLSGPVGKAVGIIAIVVTGLGFAFAEGGSVMRRGIGIVFGLAIAFTATTFITSFFNVTSGAVF